MNGLRILMLLALDLLASNHNDVDAYFRKLRGKVEPVNAWKVIYETDLEHPVDRGQRLRRCVSVCAPASIRHHSAKAAAFSDMSWEDDPLQQSCITNGEQFYWTFPFRRAFQLSELNAGEILPGSLKFELMWSVMPWQPIGDERFSWPAARSTYHIVMSEKSKPVRETQLIGDVPCFGLEFENTRLWFSVKQLGMVLQRNTFDESGQLLEELTFSNHVNSQKGLWYPKSVRRRSFTPGVLDPRLDVRFNLVEVLLNKDVPVEDFVIPNPEPGAIQSYTDGTFRQIAPGGHDYLDILSGWYQRVFVTKEKKHVSVQLSAFVIGFAAVLVALLIHRLLRSRALGDVS